MVGEKTVEFGMWLKQKLEPMGYTVHVAHKKGSGDSQGWVMQASCRMHISIVDIVISKNNDVIMLIEIEEHPASPKEVLGDVFSLLMTDVIKRSDGDIQVNDATHILVAYLSSSEDESGRAVCIAHQIKQFNPKFPYTIMTQPSVDKLIERLMWFIGEFYK